MSKELENYKSGPFNTRNVVQKLESMMDKVTEKECTSETVQTACLCAKEIQSFLKLHIEVVKLKGKFNDD